MSDTIDINIKTSIFFSYGKIKRISVLIDLCNTTWKFCSNREFSALFSNNRDLIIAVIKNFRVYGYIHWSPTEYIPVFFFILTSNTAKRHDC